MSAVLKRKVFFIRIQLLSPLNVSSGEDEWTDADVLRDGEHTWKKRKTVRVLWDILEKMKLER